MEINLSTLANLQRPQMMQPTSTSSLGTVGGDATRGMLYGNDMGKFQDTLNQMAPIAQAEGQAQMQDIQAKQEMQPIKQAAEIKKMQLDALRPYASAWDVAKSQAEKDAIWEEVVDDPVLKNLQQKDWRQMPNDMRDNYMKVARNKEVNSPQHLQSMNQVNAKIQGAQNVADTKVAGGLAQTGLKTESAERISAEKIASNEYIAKINNEAKLVYAKIEQQGRVALQKNEERIMTKITDGTATLTDRAVLTMIQQNHMANAALLAASKPAQADIPAITGGKVPMLPTPTPKLAKIPPNAPSPNNSPSYKVGDVWADDTGKSKIVRTGKLNNRVVLQLEDGRTVNGD